VQSFDRALIDERTIRVLVTDKADGDLCINGDPAVLAERRVHLVDRQWIWLNQVHENNVIELGDVDVVEQWRAVGADGVVTLRHDVALAVHGADCATIGLWSDDGAIAAVHAGWRGLERGVVESAVAALRKLSAAPLRAIVGPTICPECYEFGDDDLALMIKRFGEQVGAVTSGGRASLDTRRVLDSEFDRLGVDLVHRDSRCTACEAESLWSFRSRGDEARQALVIWIEQ